MNGISLSALMLRDADNEQGAAEARAKLRDSLAKGVNVTAKSDNEPVKEAAPDPDKEDEDEKEEREETAEAREIKPPKGRRAER